MSRGKPPWWWPALAAAAGLLVDALAWGVVSWSLSLSADALSGQTPTPTPWAFVLGCVVGAANYWLQRRRPTGG